MTTPATGREHAVPDARDLLILDAIAQDRFRARFNLDNYAGAAFGGQLLGQALAAARLTVAEWPASSLNGFFFRAGKLDQPIDYAVERAGDGRRFASRQVTAWQGDRKVFGVQCSFQKPEDGVSHQLDVADLSRPPETLPNLAEFAIRYADRLSPVLRSVFGRPFPIELRPLNPDRFLSEAARDFWFRVPTAADVPDRADHQALLALMSDYWLPGSIATRHGNAAGGYTVTSLNHSIWFHASVRAEQWLLYRTRSDWSGNGRGLAHGLIFDTQGRLVATTMQEALLEPMASLAARTAAAETSAIRPPA